MIPEKMLMKTPAKKVVIKVIVIILPLSAFGKAGLRCKNAILNNHAGKKIKHILILVLRLRHFVLGFTTLSFCVSFLSNFGLTRTSESYELTSRAESEP